MPDEIKAETSSSSAKNPSSSKNLRCSGAPFLAVGEVAHQLGLSERRVYQLIELRLLPAIRLGRSVRVPRAAWIAWLADQEKQALASIKGSVSDDVEGGG